MRDSAFSTVAVPPEFWTRADVTDALARHDIGELFRLLRQWAGLSQNRIGAATGIAQGRVSEIINGKYEVRSINSLTRIADGLAMPDGARAALGLAPVGVAGLLRVGARVLAQPPDFAAPGPGYPISTEDALTASTGLWHADAERSQSVLSAPLEPAAWNAAALAWLVSHPDGPRAANGDGRAIGRGDVARVRTSAALFAELDNRFGGAHARRALIHFLDHDAAALLKGTYTDEVGRELFASVAEASLLAAWTSYDCGLHGLAQRYFVQALRLAQSAEDRRLACSVMSAMSHQATYLGHFTDAANLARAAQTGLRDMATPALTAQFTVMEARALAGAGEARACHAAMAAAERVFEAPEPGRDPDFIAYFTEAELSAELAHCFCDLGDAGRASKHAASAAPSDGQYARSDFFVAMVQADARADQDEPEQACAVALDALRIGEPLTSARCVRYVRDFRKRLDRFGDDPVISDFTEQAANHTLWIKAA